MATRRKRRPRGVSTTQQAEQKLTPEEIQAAELEEEEAQRDPAEEAGITREDAALEREEQEAREGEDLPVEGHTPDQVDGEPESLPEGYVDIDENATQHWQGQVEPDFDQSIFERGPLAAGIRMLYALLTEAEAGYITAQVEELERVTEEKFTPQELDFLGRLALEDLTDAGLPDVAGAYRTLVRVRVEAGV